MKKTSPVTPRRFLFTLIAGMLAPGCAHLPQAVGTCGTPGEVYVTSTSDEDGRELLVERVLPGQGNCDDILITRLHYDDRGKLSRRVDEHVRCGVVEESVAAARGDRGWTVTRSRDLDHDDRFDERSVVVVPATSFDDLRAEDTGIACALAQNGGPLQMRSN